MCEDVIGAAERDAVKRPTTSPEADSVNFFARRGERRGMGSLRAQGQPEFEGRVGSARRFLGVQGGGGTASLVKKRRKNGAKRS